MLPLPNYPPTLIRGIPNKGPQFFDSLGEVTGGVFRPHDQQSPEDGFYKISINWEDNEIVDSFTLGERREDETFRYQGGAAVVLRELVDRMRQEAPWAGAVEYTREPIEGINEYHGNLWLNEDRINDGNSRKALLGRLRFTIIDFIPPIE